MLSELFLEAPHPPPINPNAFTLIFYTALRCRDQKDQVSSNCASEIFRRQEDAADDFRLDKELYESCKVRKHVSQLLDRNQKSEAPNI